MNTIITTVNMLLDIANCLRVMSGLLDLPAAYGEPIQSSRRQHLHI
ncbi:hypothetical protein QA648_30975 (plasmid) [Rhizobium sp. CB3171]|nr:MULTISPECIES: hypothetical protein [Rhizobium]UWU24224.1 hypothetical protein N2601_28805 [Rhizobium tropici]WFU05152.1 hypothetical protein QA648_30975 [Rhizobium sp. CB3171]